MHEQHLRCVHPRRVASLFFQKRKPNSGRKQLNRKRMYDEDEVEQYQKMLVESLTSVDMEEDVNATGKALTAVICSAAIKCSGQRAPFRCRAYGWTDEYGTVQKEGCAPYETYRSTMTPVSRTHC